MCRHGSAVVSGDVAVVLRMFVALSSFLMMWGDVVTYEVDCHVIMRRHRGGCMDEGLLTS